MIPVGRAQAPGTISGTVYNDANQNGVFDGTEGGLSNVTVYVDVDVNAHFGPGDYWTKTAASGYYSFFPPGPGTWNVDQVVPSGYGRTFPSGMLQVIVTSNQTSGPYNFGDHSTASGHMPNTPSPPNGPTNLARSQGASYSSSTTDADGDRVNLRFSWGDGATCLTGWISSGSTGLCSHSWSSSGTASYTVCVSADDETGLPSPGNACISVSVNDPTTSTTSPTTSASSDRDYDGVPDSGDNCPDIPNRDQADLDGNHVGDACDPDIDGDGVAQTGGPGTYLDNCPMVANPDQMDSDRDGIGDACTAPTAGCGYAGPTSTSPPSTFTTSQGAPTTTTTLQAQTTSNPPSRDTTPPSGTLTVSSSTHGSNYASANRNPSFSWTALTDSESQVGYYYALNANPSYVVQPTDAGTTGTAVRLSCISDGTWTFSVAAFSDGGSSSTAHYTIIIASNGATVGAEPTATPVAQTFPAPMTADLASPGSFYDSGTCPAQAWRAGLAVYVDGQLVTFPQPPYARRSSGGSLPDNMYMDDGDPWTLHLTP